MRGNIDLIIEHIIKDPWQFLKLLMLVFFFSFSVLSIIGFVPEYEVDSESDANLDQTISDLNTVDAGDIVYTTEESEPIHISIPSVDIDVNIENPLSRDVGVLDTALQSGAVRYPGTGTLEEDANIFLFGHSSFLPNVINKNYQAFNGLRKLKGGEEIFIDSDNTRYTYHVVSVELAEAENIVIDLRRGKRKLTLSTCNSFGAEEERYVVHAEFVDVQPL